jgi:lipopolysaccharide biosynthesis regulator YciM
VRSINLEEARRHAENGRLEEAAELFSAALETGADRAQAALGLAVVLEGSGDHDGAREADRIAIETGDPEYGARAAYHLALSWERAGEPVNARDAWRAVVDFGNDAYLPPAYLALARLADDDAEAYRCLELAIAGGDERYASLAAHDLALRLLDRSDPEHARRVLARALDTVDRERDPRTHARLVVGLGIAHLEQAITAFGGVAEDADPEVVPLAVELLARTLPLRGRDEAAEEVWLRGLAHPDTGEEVRARLRRAFADREPPWWDADLEEAARTGSLPLLADEAFGALDSVYSVLTRCRSQLPAELYDLLEQVPDRYRWGAALRDSAAE